MSADDRSVNIWDLNNYNSTAYNLVNLNSQGKKQQMPYLISSAVFNRFSQSSLFMYTTSNGLINICDIREKSDFSRKASITLSTQTESNPSVFSHWLNYVSQASFLRDSNLVVSRDFMTVRQWDLRTGKALFAAEVSDSMSRSLSVLHRNDALDDQFFMTVS